MKTLSIFIFALLISSGISAQTKATKNQQGEYVSIKEPKDSTATKTKDIYVDSKGIKYPIYLSKNGKYFVLHISKKTGKEYKHYLKLTN